MVLMGVRTVTWTQSEEAVAIPQARVMCNRAAVHQCNSVDYMSYGTGAVGAECVAHVRHATRITCAQRDAIGKQTLIVSQI